MHDKIQPTLNFREPNPGIDELIFQLIDRCGAHHPVVAREMILCALRAAQETEHLRDLRRLNTVMKEIRYTGKVFGPWRDRRKVTIFGSARTQPAEPIYQSCLAFAAELARRNYMVITGGGPGIMQAGNEGAGVENSFAANIRLPFEQGTNHVMEGDVKSVTYQYFFTRKVAFLKEAQAVALFPGGFGTLDEAMETLTLVQTGKNPPIPLVLVDDPNEPYWQPLLKLIETTLLGRGLISPDDMGLFKLTCDPVEAVDIIDRFYRVYHSMRFIGGQCVIRLAFSPSPAQIARINEEFAEMMVAGGTAQLSTALPAEEDEPELIRLPRLVIPFNRRHYGLLKSLIDHLNELDDPTA